MKRERSHGNASTAGTSWADDEEEMVKTEAKRKFRLNDADLKPLRVRVLPNPHDPNWAPMKLYRVAELTARAARTRHGTRCRAARRARAAFAALVRAARTRRTRGARAGRTAAPSTQ
jgi:hypothetical protein